MGKIECERGRRSASLLLTINNVNGDTESDTELDEFAKFAKREKNLLRYLEDVTRQAGDAQEEVLRDILSRNAGAQYLLRFGCTGTDIDADVNAFRAKLPLVEYKDVEADILRLANGETAPLLSAGPPIEFMQSSGTSKGMPKLFPSVEGDAERRFLADSFIKPVLNRNFPGLEKGKCLYFLFCRDSGQLPSGLHYQPVLSSFYKHKLFRNRPHDPTYRLTSPDDVILCTSSEQAMYCHLLLGLAQSEEVVRLGAVMGSTLVRAMRVLEQEWEQLCRDIATGTVHSRVTDPAARLACQKVLGKPNPDLASRLRRECEGGQWKGIVPRLWPNAKLMDVVTAGTMEAYIPALQEYGGSVRLISNQLYASSESYLAVNMNPLDPPDAVSYTLIPSIAYFEFVPWRNSTDQKQGNPQIREEKQGNPQILEQKQGNPQNTQAIKLVDVKVGEEYELVVTNYAGLYRYRMGDILRCTGHYNKAPSFYFVGRANASLSIDYDKTTDRDLHNAVTRASQHLQEVGLQLRDYTSFADTQSKPAGHYVIFWEVSEREPRLPSDLLDKCCRTMEESFDYVYHKLRNSNFINPLELRILKGGAFQELANFTIANGGSFAQYKAPRCLKQEKMIELLNGFVCQVQFSTTQPTFSKKV